MFKKLFIGIIVIAIFFQSLSPYVAYSQAYAKRATDSGKLVTTTITPTLTISPTITPTPNLIETPTATSTPDLTVTPTPTITQTIPTLTPMPTIPVKSQEIIQSASLTSPIFDNYINLPVGGTYALPEGQRVMITGDVIVDGLNWYDEQDNTVAVDVILDGKFHSISAKYGATLDLFTSDATLDYINQRYTDDINSIKSSGKEIDFFSVNQLDPNWQLPSKMSQRFIPGEIYSPFGVGSSWQQKLIIIGDVKIDGVIYADSTDNTVAVDIITDGVQHLIEFPWGATVIAFGVGATDQFVQQNYNIIVKSISDSGKRIDTNSLNQLQPTIPNWTNINIDPGKIYQLPQGFKAIILGDVSIDNVAKSFDSSFLVNYYDDKTETVSLDVILDTKSHNIYAQWGANLLVFNTANNEAQAKYDEFKNSIISSGKKIDPTNLNQLLPPPQLDYMIPTPAVGGIYNVPAGQRIMIFGDVKIDGRTYYDSNPNTGAIDVLMDGQPHTILFPYGGSARVFTEAATLQYIQRSFVKERSNLENAGHGLIYDVYSWLQLINIPQFP